MKQYTIFLLFTFYFLLVPSVYAGHEIGTEGKYCDGSEIWLDLPDGSHQYSDTDCALSGQICKMFPSEGLNADAVCENPPPPPVTTPIPASQIPTPDEIAIERQNQGLLPQEVVSEIQPQEKNIFQNLLGFFLQLLGFKPTFPEIFHPRSDIRQNAVIPQEIKPQSQDENKLLPEFLGEEVGIYSVDVPKEINQDNKDTRGFESTFEKANFPEGITPITGL